MQTPELKEVFDLSENDLTRHPVWIGIHGVDSAEPWYLMTKESTYRPWDRPLPASAESGSLLVRAVFRLADGGSYSGFFNVAGDAWDIPPQPHLRSFTERYGAFALLAIQQPRIFVSHQQYSFWGGRRGISVEKRQALYAAMERNSEAIFPLEFNADVSLANGILAGQVDGFYHLAGRGRTQVEF